MNADKVLSKEQMDRVFKLNPYLRDVCGVPFRDAFRLAMLIVENWEGIKNVMEGMME